MILSLQHTPSSWRQRNAPETNHRYELVLTKRQDTPSSPSPSSGFKMSKTEQTKVSVLVSLFNWIQKTKPSLKKRSKFRKFLDTYCDSSDYFSALRLILPSLDRERGSYGLKESVLATSLIDALGMSRDSQDAIRLINWRKGAGAANAGNFPLVAAEVCFCIIFFLYDYVNNSAHSNLYRLIYVNWWFLAAIIDIKYFESLFSLFWSVELGSENNLVVFLVMCFINVGLEAFYDHTSTWNAKCFHWKILSFAYSLILSPLAAVTFGFRWYYHITGS